MNHHQSARVPGVPPEDRLRVATLLSAAGGCLDAFTWLAHGGVFANAQTGNAAVLLPAAALVLAFWLCRSHLDTTEAT
ncbi:MAG: DUF1275 family protein [Rhodopila sp.]